MNDKIPRPTESRGGPSSPRKSAIPIPKPKPKVIPSPSAAAAPSLPKPKPKVLITEAAPSYDVKVVEDLNVCAGGITASTPSFEQFLAGLRVFDDEELGRDDIENANTSTVEDVPADAIGGISNRSPSFAGFSAAVAGEEEEHLEPVCPPPPRTALDLTIGEKFQAVAPGEKDQESKNEQRHRKWHRYRTNQDSASFEAVTLPRVETKSSDIFSGNSVPPSMGFLPVNLKRLSEEELGPLFITFGIGKKEPRVFVEPQMEMYPSHSGTSLLGSISIQNKTSQVITFRIRASTPKKYKVVPFVGEVPIGGESIACVETLTNLRLTFKDIKEDCFAVDIIPITRSFTKPASILLFWRAGVTGQWRFPVEVIEGHLNDPGRATRDYRSVQEAKAYEARRLKALVSSEEILLLRCLEKPMGKRVTARGLVKPGPEMLTMDVTGTFGFGFVWPLLFGILISGFMSFILFFY